MKPDINAKKLTITQEYINSGIRGLKKAIKKGNIGDAMFETAWRNTNEIHKQAILMHQERTGETFSPTKFFTFGARGAAIAIASFIEVPESGIMALRSRLSPQEAKQKQVKRKTK